MDKGTRNNLIEVSKILKSRLHSDSNSCENKFTLIFIKMIAKKLQENHGIYYVDACRIASSVKIDENNELIIEKGDPLDSIEYIAEFFAQAIVKSSMFMYDDGTKDIEVMKLMASKMEFNINN